MAQEAGRLFCPQCGNATMDKVEVTIGSEGQEQYGVRKKHNLRGTRFSLPKPKVGLWGCSCFRASVCLCKRTARDWAARRKWLTAGWACGAWHERSHVWGRQFAPFATGGGRMLTCNQGLACNFISFQQDPF